MATVIGVGVKSCTYSNLKPSSLVRTARFAISSSLQPGWPEMKYGTSCWLSPSFLSIRSNIFLNSLKCSKDGFLIILRISEDVCSGATFSLPETCRVKSCTM